GAQTASGAPDEELVVGVVGVLPVSVTKSPPAHPWPSSPWYATVARAFTLLSRYSRAGALHNQQISSTPSIPAVVLTPIPACARPRRHFRRARRPRPREHNESV